MARFIATNWFKIGILILAAIAVATGIMLFRQHNQILEQARAEAAAQAQKDAEQKTTADLQIQQEEEQVASNKASAQSKINSCISAAQAERDRRLANVESVWEACLVGPYPDTCTQLQARIDTETNPAIYRKYDEWVDECQRGVQPNLKEQAY